MIAKKKVLLGLTGGIAVYKMCSLINHLKKGSNEVKVIMTKAATEFVTPLTFETLTNSEVYLDGFNTKDKTHVEHIYLADWCDICVIAPVTSNTISKIAYGICDNLLTTVVAALPPVTPILFAPAMNCHMWENPILQENIAKLKKIRVESKRKYHFIDPISGNLACGYQGKGKVADNKDIISKIEMIMHG